jgi:hypothetical protein
MKVNGGFIASVEQIARDLLRSSAFHLGVAEAEAGHPPNFDRFPGAADAWDYERGRQIALRLSAIGFGRLPKQAKFQALVRGLRNGSVE